MVTRHPGMALLVLLAGQVCTGCHKDDDENTHVGSLGPITSDGEAPTSTGTSTGEALTTDDTGTTADLTATAPGPGEAPVEPICAFYGVKRELCDEEGDDISEAEELACRDDVHQGTLADGEACHEAYADLYYCKTAGGCADLDGSTCPEQVDAVTKACPHHPPS